MTQTTLAFKPCTPIRDRVLTVLQRGGYWNKFAIRDTLQSHEGSCIDTDTIAAKVRDLRKAKYGGHTITSRPVKGKSYREYQLIT